MTREHTLSLIVGFSIVLLVAVLISDHFSSAQQQSLGLADAGEPAAVTTNTPPRQLQAPAPTGRGLTQQLATATVPTTRSTAPTPTTSATQATPEPMSQPQKLVINQGSRPIAGRAGGSPSPTPRVGTNPTPSGDSSLLVQGRDALASLRDRIQQNGMEYLQDAPVAAEVGTRPIAGNQSTARTPGIRLAAGTSAVQPSPTATPRNAAATPTRLHVGQEGESLYRIAERFYGDGNLWRKLAAHNTDRVAENGSVRVGVALKIPERSVLVGTARVAPATPKRATTVRTPAPKPATTRTYTVRKGDTLGAICSRELGSSKRMDDVVALNPKLESADMIYVGMKLKLPAK